MSGWDPVWEQIFRERGSWGKYPPEDLVRFIASNFYRVSDRRSIRILDLGCGPGSGGGWFIAREGFNYFGIDGAPTAIEKMRERLNQEGLKGELCEGDIQSLPYPVGFFDGVVEVACLQHINEAATRRVISEIHRVLKTGGKHFSMSSAAGTYGDSSGRRLDQTTWSDLMVGPFAGMGTTRFATRESLETLYQDFRKVELNKLSRTLAGTNHLLSNWLITCEK